MSPQQLARYKTVNAKQFCVLHGVGYGKKLVWDAAMYESTGVQVILMVLFFFARVLPALEISRFKAELLFTEYEGLLFSEYLKALALACLL